MSDSNYQSNIPSSPKLELFQIVFWSVINRKLKHLRIFTQVVGFLIRAQRRQDVSKFVFHFDRIIKVSRPINIIFKLLTTFFHSHNIHLD